MNALLIVGGSDAGISAALRAREINPQQEVTVIVADEFPNFSLCGLPYYLSGEVKNWKSLAHRTKEQIEAEGINLLLKHKALAVDPTLKIVRVEDSKKNQFTMRYGRLLIATGAVSDPPHIKGMEFPGVFLLRWMENGFAIQKFLCEKAPRSAIVIGGGYIGMEMADALVKRGLTVTVIEHSDTVLRNMGPFFGRIIAQRLRDNGVSVVNGVRVKQILKANSQLQVKGSQNFVLQGDMILVAAGIRPRAELAAGINLQTGIKGAICVNRRMETSFHDIFAAGDCVETWHNVLGKYVYLPLGTTAHKQGRIAGENAAGGSKKYKGTMGTQVIKIFDCIAARTGLLEAEAREAGFDPAVTQLETWDHKHYYPGAQKIILRILGDRKSGRLLGVQILGSYQSEISKRIDVFASALYHKMKIAELNDFDLSYTPALSNPWDPVQMCAQAWEKEW